MSKRNNKPKKSTFTPHGLVRDLERRAPMLMPPVMTQVQVDNHILRLLQLYTSNTHFRNSVDKILTKY